MLVLLPGKGIKHASHTLSDKFYLECTQDKYNFAYGRLFNLLMSMDISINKKERNKEPTGLKLLDFFLL